MPPVIHWKTEAIIRLIACVFLSVFLGSTLSGLLHHVLADGSANSQAVWLGTLSILLSLSTLCIIALPWPFQASLSRLGFAAGSFYGALFLGAWCQRLTGSPQSSIQTTLISSLALQGSILIFSAWVLREHRVSPKDAFGLSQHLGKSVLYGVIIACIFLPIGWLLNAGSIELLKMLPWKGWAVGEQQTVQILRGVGTWPARLGLGLAVIVLAPLGEEILFRGLLYSWLKQLGFRRLAMWSTSAIFALVHFNLPSFLPLLIFAVLLVRLYEKWGNLAAPLAAHVTFNAFGYIALFLQRSPT